METTQPESIRDSQHTQSASSFDDGAPQTRKDGAPESTEALVAATEDDDATGTSATDGKGEHPGKKGKKRLFGFVKRKDGDSKTEQSKASGETKPTSPKPTSAPKADAPALSQQSASIFDVPSPTRRSTVSPIRSESSRIAATSPTRGLASSPRLHSPAGSQIFERDVQESTTLSTASGPGPVPSSPAIPSHIQTENYIPSVLDASSEAITDDHLSPDTVEIVTHSYHQPARLSVAASVAATSSSPSYDQLAFSWAEELSSALDPGDSAANFVSARPRASGGVATPSPPPPSSLPAADASIPDVRRLSFVSFADVVQAEQVEHHGAAYLGTSSPAGRDSMHYAPAPALASLAAITAANRSPSPVRSPVSSQGPGTSPPTSKSGSVKGLEMSPSRKPLQPAPLGSPGSPPPHLTLGVAPSDLNIETMSQALRRTGSADLKGMRSAPTSPIEGPSAPSR